MAYLEEFNFEKASEDAGKLVLLSSAQTSGIFKALFEERDFVSLKNALGADERALFIVIEALCSLGYVEKNGNRYIISDAARPLFIERGEAYVGDFLPFFLPIMGSCFALPEIIKGEKPKWNPDKFNVSVFVNAMASRSDETIEEAVNLCLKRKNDAKNVLDLGGGPGKYSRAFANRGLKVVLYDIPPVIDYVSGAFGLKKIKNLTLTKGDFTADSFESLTAEARFDMVYMGNIFHMYSPEDNVGLLRDIGKTLAPGGMIAIEDFVRGRSPVAELFAVNMLANTQGGNTYIEAQYIEWLEDMGFCEIEIADFDNKERQLITGFLAHGKP